MRQTVKMLVTRWCLLATLGSVLVLTSCFGTTETSSERERNANTPAGKVGKVAHEAAKEGGKAARAAGRKLNEAARQARDGWEQSSREDANKSAK